MKTEYLPLAIAIIAAAASIAGVAASQYGALKLERQKWEQGQSDLKRKSLEIAVLSYARDLGNAVQHVEILAWTALNDSPSVTPEVIVEYNKASMEALRTIAGHRLVLVAQNPNAAAATDRAALAFHRADDCIVKAGVQLRAKRNIGLSMLGSCKQLSERANAILFHEFKAILTAQPP